MEWLTKVPDLFKLNTKHLALVAFVSGFLALAPDATLNRLRVTVPPPFDTVAGIVFLMSSGLVLINSIAAIHTTWLRTKYSKKLTESIQESLNQLDPAEQAVIREFLLCNSTIKMPIDNPTVAGLIALRILERIGSLGNGSIHGMEFPLRLSEKAKQLVAPQHVGLTPYLDENGLLDGSSPQLERFFHENRPPFKQSNRYGLY